MTDIDTILTQGFLNEAFHYQDGALFWKVRPLHHFKSEGDRTRAARLFESHGGGFRNPEAAAAIRRLGKEQQS